MTNWRRSMRGPSRSQGEYVSTTAFPALKEAQGKLESKQDELGKIFEEAGEEFDFAKVKSISGTTREKAAHVRKLNDECAELAKEVEDYLAVKAAAERQLMNPRDARDGRGSEPGSTDGRNPSTKTLGQLFVESKAYKERRGSIGPEATLDIELKTLMTTTAGWAPEVLRTGRVVDFATRPIQVSDLIPQTETSQSAVQYMEETTFTNSATETAEAGTFPESALVLTERTSNVRKIATFLPVTDEQLEDVPQARGYIDNRLPFML